MASLVGNFSPVKRRRAILVRRIRHLRGEMGDELKRRAGLRQLKPDLSDLAAYLPERLRFCPSSQRSGHHLRPSCRSSW